MPYDYLALLRGINVGGKNKLPMKDLAEMFLKAGCTDARTFIQSGNVLFNAPAKVAMQIAGVLPGQIEKRFGHRPPIVIRTAEQLAVVAASNPFLQAGAEEDMVHVLFLADTPDAVRVKELDGARSTPDAFSVRGAEVYLHLPNGAARTKLTNAYFDSQLATVSTGRNWRTVTALLKMMQGGE
jgi:uncharacterized protein (DUF1697 family)